jgi:hypothetical protein
MTNEYFPPKHGERKFHCAHCGVYAEQKWSHMNACGDEYTTKGDWGNIVNRSNILNTSKFTDKLPEHYTISRCEHCLGLTLWHKGSMILPRIISVTQPNEDLSDDIKQLYNEAANILQDSPRAAAALIRLALQVLCKELGEKGKDINDDIKSLVAKGLDTRVQKAMDSLRVVGNNGAHPGEINLNENRDKVVKMFDIINFIAQKMITDPKELDSFFDDLPDGAKKAIEKRDNKGKTV